MSNPLTVQHQKMGAVLGRDDTPLNYGDTESEYWSVKNSVGLVDLSHLGRLTVSGKDRISFLNGLLTNDLSLLKGETGIRSALLTSKARVLADLYLYALEESLLVDAGEASARRVKSILDQFVITEDVQIQDSTAELLHFSLQGPKAAEALKSVLGVDYLERPELSYVALGPSLIIVRDRSGLGGYDVLLPMNEAEATWQGFLLKGAGVVAPVGLDAIDILRLEKGLPKYGVDVDENTIVLEAGFKDAISYGKGCYMGQEVVARATHIGRVNRLLVQLEVDGRTVPGLKAGLFSDGKEAGFLTSAAYSPGRGKVLSLGYVRRDVAVEGTQLTVDASGGSRRAVVVRPI